MNTFKQMLRQPLRTVLGVILMTLSVAILCVSVGQVMAVQYTGQKLEQEFSTIAIPLSGIDENSAVSANGIAYLQEDLVSWLDTVASENPDLIEQVARHGVLSAYIPQLTPLNITQEKFQPYTTRANYDNYWFQPRVNRLYNLSMSGTYDAIPYNCAMLVITLEAVGEPVERHSVYAKEGLQPKDFVSLDAYYAWYMSAEKQSVTMGYQVELTGTVTQVISLQEGYRDPVGRIARLVMTVPDLEALEEMDLVPGEQYIVYGVDYADSYWKLEGTLNHDGELDFLSFYPFDPEALSVLSEKEREDYMARYELTNDTYWRDTVAYYHGIALNEAEYKMVNAISMTLMLPIPLEQYTPIRDEDGMLLEIQKNSQMEYETLSGETVTVSYEDYIHTYQIPTIARLEGTAEDFLETEDGLQWREALERDRINNHAFAVIGVDQLSYLTDFSTGRMKLTEGRDFTGDECSNGSAVCIIHEELALANGLTVGDTLTLNYYSDDPGLPYHAHRTSNVGILNPSATLYFTTTPIMQTREYTIVGICRSEETWADVAENPYSFSANTVYVPKASVDTPMETYDSILLVSVVLKNGGTEAFAQLAQNAGYADRFRYSDQGYSTVAKNFNNYEELAQQVLWCGVGVNAVLVLLFLIFFPGAQRSVAVTMESLGAGWGRRFGHVLLTAALILIPATVLGSSMGVLLWDTVVSALRESADAGIGLELEQGTLYKLGAAQLLVTFALSAVVAAWIARRRRMSGRK